jgi:superfamily II RNA helicase
MMTGDASVNPRRPMLCCTAEILANMALRAGGHADVDDVVMDEFHYYSDAERGIAWQVPLLTLPQTRFLLMSATLGDMTSSSESLERLTGAAVVTVQLRRAGAARLRVPRDPAARDHRDVPAR